VARSEIMPLIEIVSARGNNSDIDVALEQQIEI